MLKTVYLISCTFAISCISGNPTNTLLHLTKEDGKNILIGAAAGTVHGLINVGAVHAQLPESTQRDINALMEVTAIAGHTISAIKNPGYVLEDLSVCQPSLPTQVAHGITQGLIEGSYNKQTRSFDRIGFSINLMQLFTVCNWARGKVASYLLKEVKKSQEQTAATIEEMDAHYKSLVPFPFRPFVAGPKDIYLIANQR
jgi:hypothetical protein